MRLCLKNFESLSTDKICHQIEFFPISKTCEMNEWMSQFRPHMICTSSNVLLLHDVYFRHISPFTFSSHFFIIIIFRHKIWIWTEFRFISNSEKGKKFCHEFSLRKKRKKMSLNIFECSKKTVNIMNKETVHIIEAVYCIYNYWWPYIDCQ